MEGKSAPGSLFAAWGRSHVAQDFSVRRAESWAGWGGGGGGGVSVLELQFFSYLTQCKRRKVTGLGVARLKVFLRVVKAQQ